MADDQDDSQKTEEPTQKKLDDAFKKGQVAHSREVASFFMLLALGMVLLAMGPGIMTDAAAVLAPFITAPHDMVLDEFSFKEISKDLLLDIAAIMALPIAITIFAAIASARVQHRLAFSLESIKPKFEKISPLKGLKRMFSLRSVVEFVKGILKISIVGFIAFASIWPFLESFRLLPSLHLGDTIHMVEDMATRMIVGACAVMFFIAGFDFMYQKFEHIKQLKMSKKDIKDEHKDQEGDPHVKAKLRQLRAERAQNRMMQAVPNADVIITNPTHYSVALKYDRTTMDAPIVTAKGADNIALKIREIAKENDVPLVENVPLARALFDTTEIDQPIPLEQYQAAAEVISYVFRLKGKV